MKISIKHKRQRRGFTTIEIIVAMFVASLVGLAVSSFIRDTFSLNRFISDSLSAQDEGRRMLKTAVAEIRSLSPSSMGAYPILTANSTTFTFYCDIDDDGKKEQIRYFLDGTILKKGVIKPSSNPLTYNPANEVISEVVHGIVNGATPIFEFYDSSYDGTGSALSIPVNVPDVRLAKITLVIDRNTEKPPAALTLTTQVSMRNLKDNL